MHIETYNCIGEENKKKFYAKLKELEDEVAKNPGHWGPELELDAFRQFGEVIVWEWDDEDKKKIKEIEDERRSNCWKD